MNSTQQVKADNVMTFAGIEVATTSNRDTSLVVEACMRNAAIKAAHGIFSVPWNDLDSVPGEQAKGAHVRDAQRWPLLEAALRTPAPPLALVNRFLPGGVQASVRAAEDLEEHDEIPLVCECRGQADRKAKQAAAAVLDEWGGPLPRLGSLRNALLAEHSLLPYCLVSGASALAAQALRVQPGQRVLDLCAGPGAKSLVLATMLFAPSPGGKAGGASELLAQAGVEAGLLPRPDSAAAAGGLLGGGGKLVCNEPNKTRAAVLEGLLASFLPASLLSAGAVAVTRVEASERAAPALKKHGPFDKVLVDPPCTAARAKAGAGAEGDLPAVKKNAELAEGLLRCAGELVRPGGLIIYCTHSIEERENEDVIARFLRRMDGSFKAEVGTEDAPICGAEPTQCGTMILPDQGTRYGPLYFAQLRRAA